MADNTENEEFQFAGIPLIGLDKHSENDSVEFNFTKNDFNLTEWAKLLTSKIKTICQTLVPLIEVALIELLGNSDSYVRNEGKVEYDSKTGTFECSFSYFVKRWLTNQEVSEDLIKDDALYVFNKIKVVKGIKTWKQCSIDVSKGLLTVAFVI